MAPSASDLIAILPFIFAASGGLLVVLLDSFTHPESPRRFLGGFSLVFLGAMGLSAWLGDGAPQLAFSGLVVADDFSRFLTILFALAAGLGALIAMGRLPEEGAARGEFYALLLFSAGGASLLAQAADLITLFLGLEMVSIPAYAMAASIRRDSRSAEAGFKYFVLGAFATGFLIFGIALLYGAAGGTSLAKIAAAASGVWTDSPRLVFGALFLLVGLVFKIAAVPFHMWAPDVYCGSPTPATAYFAAGIKAAGFAALLRVLFVALPELKVGPGALERAGWHYVIMGLAYATMFVPTLVALVQKDVKRILAYSSVAHAGYLLIGLLAGKEGSAAILFYLTVYTFMTVGAFAIVAYFEHRDGGTNLADYSGLGKRHPYAAAAMAVFLFSLAGIPPMGGFLAKFYLFRAALANDLKWLTILGVMASLISAYYYLRVTVAMYMEQEQPAEDTPAVRPSAAVITVVAICLALVLVLGVYPVPVLAAAQAAALP